MDGKDHVLFAVTGQLVAGTVTGLPPIELGISCGLAAAVSAGKWVSPDADLGWLGWIPGVKHRGITHWWAWPALAAWWALHHDLGDAWWIVWALILGWTSHLLGDFIFGERPPGIPVLPWGVYVGLRLNSGGWVEKIAVPVLLAAVAWLTLHLGSRA